MWLCVVVCGCVWLRVVASTCRLLRLLRPRDERLHVLALLLEVPRAALALYHLVVEPHLRPASWR